MKFIDEATIFVQSGAGGNGCISFRREKYVPRGGPDGGDGGNGGSIVLIGNTKLTTLYDLKLHPHYRARRGEHGKGKNMHGRSGKDVFIQVPLGVVVYSNSDVIGDILDNGQKIIVARGGAGGRGNARFVTSTNRAPRQVEEGTPGVTKEVKIVLKIISDIGIVGLPNAGKSTLLRAMTNARPKIDNYPFTTLSPNLGVLRNNRKNIVIADMPGIIEGAHQGKGIGLQFLRHIERTNLLILVVDISVPKPMDQYKSLLNEFRQYNPQLLSKPRIIVFNKIDLLNLIPPSELKEKIFFVSALKGIGVDRLMDYLKNEN
ncbi:MAG: GTPase ObgE [candidate division WOR-3 bacterium]|nr:MAG: GTPase ObgE [candidate division WOR-3 bacterium]